MHHEGWKRYWILVDTVRTFWKQKRLVLITVGYQSQGKFWNRFRVCVHVCASECLCPFGGQGCRVLAGSQESLWLLKWSKSIEERFPLGKKKKIFPSSPWWLNENTSRKEFTDGHTAKCWKTQDRHPGLLTPSSRFVPSSTSQSSTLIPSYLYMETITFSKMLFFFSPLHQIVSGDAQSSATAAGCGLWTVCVNCPSPERRLTEPEPNTQSKGILLDLEIPRHALGNEDLGIMGKPWETDWRYMAFKEYLEFLSRESERNSLSI